MAMDIISNKINTGKYADLHALKADVDLMFKNARTFNAIGSVIYNDAGLLNKLFSKGVEVATMHLNNIAAASGLTGAVAAEPIRLTIKPFKKQVEQPASEEEIQVQSQEEEIEVTKQKPAKTKTRQPYKPRPNLRLKPQEVFTAAEVKLFCKHVEDGVAWLARRFMNKGWNPNYLVPRKLFGSEFEWAGMHAACFFGQKKVIDALMDYGADVELPDGWYGSRPLAWAAFGEHFDICKMLIEKYGADPFGTNRDGQIAFDLVSTKDDPKWKGVLIDIPGRENPERVILTESIQSSPARLDGGLSRSDSGITNLDKSVGGRVYGEDEVVDIESSEQSLAQQQFAHNQMLQYQQEALQIATQGRSRSSKQQQQQPRRQEQRQQQEQQQQYQQEQMYAGVPPQMMMPPPGVAPGAWMPPFAGMPGMPGMPMMPPMGMMPGFPGQQQQEQGKQGQFTTQPVPFAQQAQSGHPTSSSTPIPAIVSPPIRTLTNEGRPFIHRIKVDSAEDETASRNLVLVEPKDLPIEPPLDQLGENIPMIDGHFFTVPNHIVNLKFSFALFKNLDSAEYDQYYPPEYQGKKTSECVFEIFRNNRTVVRVEKDTDSTTSSPVAAAAATEGEKKKELPTIKVSSHMLSKGGTVPILSLPVADGLTSFDFIVRRTVTLIEPAQTEDSVGSWDEVQSFSVFVTREVKSRA